MSWGESKLELKSNASRGEATSTSIGTSSSSSSGTRRFYCNYDPLNPICVAGHTPPKYTWYSDEENGVPPANPEDIISSGDDDSEEGEQDCTRRCRAEVLRTRPIPPVLQTLIANLSDPTDEYAEDVDMRMLQTFFAKMTVKEDEEKKRILQLYHDYLKPYTEKEYDDTITNTLDSISSSPSPTPTPSSDRRYSDSDAWTAQLEREKRTLEVKRALESKLGEEIVGPLVRDMFADPRSEQELEEVHENDDYRARLVNPSNVVFLTTIFKFPHLYNRLSKTQIGNIINGLTDAVQENIEDELNDRAETTKGYFDIYPIGFGILGRNKPLYELAIRLLQTEVLEGIDKLTLTDVLKRLAFTIVYPLGYIFDTGDYEEIQYNYSEIVKIAQQFLAIMAELYPTIVYTDKFLIYLARIMGSRSCTHKEENPFSDFVANLDGQEFKSPLLSEFVAYVAARKRKEKEIQEKMRLEELLKRGGSENLTKLEMVEKEIEDLVAECQFLKNHIYSDKFQT